MAKEKEGINFLLSFVFNFILSKGFVIPIYFFMAFDFTNNSDLVFCAFFTVPDYRHFDPNKEAWIITDDSGHIEGVT